jgi:hypothetical protein
MQPQNKGKTLWEMLMDRLHAGGNGSGIPFANPLDLRVGSAVRVPFANGPEFNDIDFTVGEIREYTRQIDAQAFQFTDYVLAGVNTKSFDADQMVKARLRVVPNTAGAHDSVLLRLYDEFAFAQDFLDLVKDDTDVFEIAGDQPGNKETYTRINDLRVSYQAAVMVIAGTTPDGKAAPGKAAPAKLEYWDYWRDSDLGGGHTAKEFVFVEMNSDTGWFQLWRGREFFE